MQNTNDKLTKEILINHNSTLPKTYSQLIQKVGGGGNYQRNMLFIFILVFFVTGTILMSTSFIFMNNQYSCSKVGLLVNGCKKTVCQIDDTMEREKYFVKNKQGIESIATEYGPFICEDQFLLDMIKSSPYFGSLIGFILSTIVADSLGRKRAMLISLGTATFGSILMVISTNLWLITFSLILTGAGINVSSALCFCYLGQVVSDIKRQKYSILIQISFTVGSMFLTGCYYLIGNWRVNSILLQVLPVTVAFLLFLLYVQDTPMFLLRGEDQRALKALNRIGQINFGIKDILTKDDIDNVRQEQLVNEKFNMQKPSPLDLFRFKSLRKTTILSCLLGYIVLSMYYGPALVIDSIGFNMYVSSFAIQLSQLVGFIPTYYLIDKVKRRTSGFFLLITTVISSFILIIFPKPDNCDMCLQSVIEVIVIFVFRFAIATELILFLVYIVELFPTRVVGIGVSAVNVAVTVASTLCPIILGALERIGISFMTFFFILGILGSAITLLLQETHKKPIKEEIQEILRAKNNNKSQHIGSQQTITTQKTLCSRQSL